MGYSNFVDSFAGEVNDRLTGVETNLYKLGEFILTKCEEGKIFGKKKDEVFNDLCSHPGFRYSKSTLRGYSQAANFIKQLPEEMLAGQHLPFTSVVQIATAKLPQKEKIKLLNEAQEVPTTRQVVRQKIQAKRLEIYPPSEDKDWLIPFDLWQFNTCDPRFGQAGYPGRIPGQIILNLIHYYMEGDIFLSVYSGSHTDRDACSYLGKKCIELAQNVLDPWQIETGSVDFIFHDPPYWHAKATEYERQDDLSHLPLDAFYQALEFTAKESQRTLKTNGKVAIIIGNERNPYEDLGFNVYQIFKRYLTPIDRLVVPYAGTSQMHTAWAIAHAKEARSMLNGFRDLIIFKAI